MKHSRALSLACALLFSAPFILAQGQGGPEGGPRPERHEGRGLGVPPGTWWKNPSTIQTLSLTADQQKHLDDIFLESRIQLVHMHASLEEEQLKLEPLLNTNPPDQTRALTEISKIADLRADLEKADAKMLLNLRAVLTAAQWTKLQTEQRAHRDERAGNPRTREGERPAREGRGDPSGPNAPDLPPTPSHGPTE